MEINPTSPRENIIPSDFSVQPPKEAVEGSKDVFRPTNTESSIDFRNMSREQLKVWVNEEIKAGNMSLDESRPFMHMTLSLDAETLESINGSKSVNFIEMAKNLAEFHRSVGNHESADGLERILEIMRRDQRGPLSVTA